MIGTAIGTAGLTAAAFAPSAQLLIAFMFITGAGTSIVPIAGIGAVFRTFPTTRRAWALGIRQTGVPLGGVIAAVDAPRARACGRRAGCAPVRRRCALGVRDGVRARRGRRSGGRVAPCAPAASARASTAGYGPAPCHAACYVVVLQSVLAYSVPSARDAGFSAFAAGAMFFVFQITAGVARIVWGRVADLSGGNRRARTLAETGWLAAGGALVFAAALHVGPAAALLAAIAFGFGALGWNALIYVSAGERAPLELAGQSVAVAGTLIFLIGAGSAPPMGALAEHAGWNVFWVVVAAFALCGSLIAIRLGSAPGAGSRPGLKACRALWCAPWQKARMTEPIPRTGGRRARGLDRAARRAAGHRARAGHRRSVCRSIARRPRCRGDQGRATRSARSRCGSGGRATIAAERSGGRCSRATRNASRSTSVSTRARSSSSSS